MLKQPCTRRSVQPGTDPDPTETLHKTRGSSGAGAAPGLHNELVQGPGPQVTPINCAVKQARMLVGGSTRVSTQSRGWKGFAALRGLTVQQSDTAQWGWGKHNVPADGASPGTAEEEQTSRTSRETGEKCNCL